MVRRAAHGMTAGFTASRGSTIPTLGSRVRFPVHLVLKRPSSFCKATVIRQIHWDRAWKCIAHCGRQESQSTWFVIHARIMAHLRAESLESLALNHGTALMPVNVW